MSKGLLKGFKGSSKALCTIDPILILSAPDFSWVEAWSKHRCFPLSLKIVRDGKPLLSNVKHGLYITHVIIMQKVWGQNLTSLRRNIWGPNKIDINSLRHFPLGHWGDSIKRKSITSHLANVIIWDMTDMWIVLDLSRKNVLKFHVALKERRAWEKKNLGFTCTLRLPRENQISLCEKESELIAFGKVTEQMQSRALDCAYLLPFFSSLCFLVWHRLDWRLARWERDLERKIASGKALSPFVLSFTTWRPHTPTQWWRKSTGVDFLFFTVAHRWLKAFNVLS